MYEAGLVLEGGGLRGLYTSGVLDAFLDNNIEFPYVIGVSAGVCNALSYVSKQRGRSRDININYINDKRYFGVGNLFRTGYIFGAEMMFHLIPDVYMPFDYDTFENSNSKLIAVATDCETGKAVYYEVKDLKDHYDVVQASSSLPFVSRMVDHDKRKLLDGGIADSIPIKRSIADGNAKNVVVLTQHKGFRKTPFKAPRITERFYKNYPNLVSVIENRYIVYNESLDYIDELEEENKVFVIRPSRPLGLSRFEKNIEKLNDAYELGYNDTIKQIEKLKKFLSE